MTFEEQVESAPTPHSADVGQTVAILRWQVGNWKNLHQQARQALLNERLANRALRKEVKRQAQTIEGMRSQNNSAKAVVFENESLKKQVTVAASVRVRELEKQVEDLKGEVNLLKKHRFGKTSEKNKGSESAYPRKKIGKRGQKRGSKGHGRRRHEDLPVKTEVIDIPDHDRQCLSCGKKRIALQETEDSHQIEIEIKAHKRVIKRRKYRTGCCCPNQPKIVTASAEAKLIPKGAYGTSIWVASLLDKYLFQRPTHRFIEAMKTHGLELPQGSITDGFKRLSPLFDPVLAGIIAKSRTETHWHVDETGWHVFEEVEGKKNNRWWLWVFRSQNTVVFSLDQSRSAAVPNAHFGGEAKGIISSDRFKSYKALTKDGRFVNAFCWAHLRRDFVELLPWPKLKPWAMNWIDRIGKIYRLNDQRLAAWSIRHMPAFNAAQEALRIAVFEFGARATIQKMCDAFDERQLKVLASLEVHWSGLIVFLNYPDIPMDNNTAEREIRGMVVGRKNYYGSGAVWSGELAAKIYSITKTLLLWKINPQSWMSKYLAACANEDHRQPGFADRFLPWNMDEATRNDLRMPGHKQSDTSQSPLKRLAIVP